MVRHWSLLAADDLVMLVWMRKHLFFGNNRSYRILCDPWYPKDGSCRKFLFWRLSARDPSEPAWWSICSVQKILQTKQNCMQSATFHYEIGSLLSRVGHMCSTVLMLGCNGCSDFIPDRDAHFPNLGAQGPEWTKADSVGVLWPCYYGMAIPCFGMCCCWAFEWQWWSSIDCSHCDACSRLAKSCLCRTKVWTKTQVVVCKANMHIPHHTTHMHNILSQDVWRAPRNALARFFGLLERSGRYLILDQIFVCRKMRRATIEARTGRSEWLTKFSCLPRTALEANRLNREGMTYIRGHLRLTRLSQQSLGVFFQTTDLSKLYLLNFMCLLWARRLAVPTSGMEKTLGPWSQKFMWLDCHYRWPTESVSVQHFCIWTLVVLRCLDICCDRFAAIDAWTIVGSTLLINGAM